MLIVQQIKPLISDLAGVSAIKDPHLICKRCELINNSVRSNSFNSATKRLMYSLTCGFVSPDHIPTTNGLIFGNSSLKQM